MMKEGIKPIYAVMANLGWSLLADTANMKLYPVWFSERAFTREQIHMACAIVIYKPLTDPEHPFHILKDRYLGEYKPMNCVLFAAYVDAWNDVINEYNAK